MYFRPKILFRSHDAHLMKSIAENIATNFEYSKRSNSAHICFNMQSGFALYLPAQIPRTVRNETHYQVFALDG